MRFLTIRPFCATSSQIPKLSCHESCKIPKSLKNVEDTISSWVVLNASIFDFCNYALRPSWHAPDNKSKLSWMLCVFTIHPFKTSAYRISSHISYQTNIFWNWHRTCFRLWLLQVQMDCPVAQEWPSRYLETAWGASVGNYQAVPIIHVESRINLLVKHVFAAFPSQPPRVWLTVLVSRAVRSSTPASEKG